MATFLRYLYEEIEAGKAQRASNFDPTSEVNRKKNRKLHVSDFCYLLNLFQTNDRSKWSEVRVSVGLDRRLVVFDGKVRARYTLQGKDVSAKAFSRYIEKRQKDRQKGIVKIFRGVYILELSVENTKLRFGSFYPECVDYWKREIDQIAQKKDNRRRSTAESECPMESKPSTSRSRGEDKEKEPDESPSEIYQNERKKTEAVSGSTVRKYLLASKKKKVEVVNEEDIITEDPRFLE